MRAFVFRLTPVCLAISSAFGCLSVAEAEEEKTLTLSPVVVTATRQAQNSFDLPIAIDVVTEKDIKDGQLQMQLSESLIRVPGITAQNRTQQAQDPQISSRGFGSRSSFGVRGVRVYVDGIPLTMPDGQGQPGVVDLSAIKSIEVMRGPFSSLYGNSSGGVIQMFTRDAPPTPTIGATTMFGSYDTKRNVLEAAGQLEGLEYMLNISNFESDGYRDHSSSNKKMATAKFKININEGTKLTTLINWFEQDAQDPLGLTRVDVSRDRKAVVGAAIGANTQVSRNHTQVGFNLEHAINETNKLSFIPYVGTRENSQILPFNPTGTNARTSQISRSFYGSDLRWDNNGIVFGRKYNVSVGVNYGKSEDDRLDINTQIAGAPANVTNRDEVNISTNYDRYVQGMLSATEKIDLHAGLRRTKVNLKVKDNLIAGFGDNSGSVSYNKTNPVIGATWKVTPEFNIYTNYGKGFETPSFIEAAYNSTTNGATPNLSLKPSTSENFEIGTKAYLTDNTKANLTLYYIKTDDEIVVSQIDFANRSVFTNANKSIRKGAEFSIESNFENNISTYFSYTLLSAKFDSDFTSPANGLIASGNRIPGTYSNQAYGEIRWRYEPLGFYTALEGRYNSKVYVNDRNTDAASSYAIFNIRAGFEQLVSNWMFKEFIRIENLADKEFIGSVRINDANSRFFEPAAERNYLLGLSAQYKF
ncbi:MULTISPECIES: TonB-dependent receptor [unclassified Methylophilus]|uniref:TonB-dependent receptor family protein n=1 Tax=unclassified Methylophilus TaxID=2630143 RepID=UPI0006F8C613|nr:MULTISPECIES: TonB-dependent receptor [unclassified Methylophilus]KQT44050.1 TonB-dependent receptor [Methylophilus sp. Leaf416]KQT59534.1 TonB-dependent receptor [Methylophilus sp. Leaf459]